MQDNLSLEEEEIVHENSTSLQFHVHPFLGAVINIVAFVILFGLPVLAHFAGGG